MFLFCERHSKSNEPFLVAKARPVDSTCRGWDRDYCHNSGHKMTPKFSYRDELPLRKSFMHL